MKKKLGSFIIFVILIFLIAHGFLGNFFKFCTWLVTLNMTQSNVSAAGENFVKIAVWIFSYSAVGLLFKTIGIFDKKAMKFTYFIISTLVSFALCYIVMLLEKYLLYIAITLCILLFGVFSAFIIYHIKSKRKKESENRHNESEV